MLYRLQRHPFAVNAFFRRSLVLTYALPRAVLEPLLPPGLSLDTYGDWGFLAIAMVQTQRLRPNFLPPACGCNVFLSGYRIFTRFGSSLRGLYILRSDTDRRLMVHAGNLFTHYRYSLCRATVSEGDDGTLWRIGTPRSDADLRVWVPAQAVAADLPAGSPFRSRKDARRYAGPLPYTFDYESRTHSIIRVLGVRTEWNPRLVNVQVRQNSFLEHQPFAGGRAQLASAFELHDVPYRWQRGTRVPLEIK